jgi:hypothetical protein
MMILGTRSLKYSGLFNDRIEKPLVEVDLNLPGEAETR